MARPKKQTVDYFPHYCNGGRSLSILQNQHGNDGFSFWFKLLQLLGKSEGHYYDYSNSNDWLFLITETHVTESMAEKILETLAGIGSIDYELWQKKIIWSQHFVDNVADVYVRRKADVPLRPGTPIPEPAPPITVASGAKIKGMIKYYEEQLGKTLTPRDLDKLKDFADNYPDGWFEKAVDEAKNSKEPIKSPMSYFGKIMETWHTNGGPDARTERISAHSKKSTSNENLKDGLTKPLD
ncbi:hypothetical protein LCGC14_0387980 [marine sediment metagenome]|uniref:Lin1244/Lin1753-like N-terminal domain-containing protein n=1 Tax=marine sediment metagenome TaxID=412755 RepID=A0A0F9VMP3_9ZZZZ